MSKKTDEKFKSLKHCAACPCSRPREYRPFVRLWEYMTCSRVKEPISEVDFCPLVR